MTHCPRSHTSPTSTAGDAAVPSTAPTASSISSTLTYFDDFMTTYHHHSSQVAHNAKTLRNLSVIESELVHMFFDESG